MAKQICFIGASGAGKSHTIHELITPENAVRALLKVSDAFAHGTMQETAIAFDDFEVLDTRGLDGDFDSPFDDDEVVASIKALTHPNTLFVWVINGDSRRYKRVMTCVKQIVGDRRLIVFINDRNNRPLTKGWQVCTPSKERAALITDITTCEGLVAITDNHLAIVPFAIGCHLGDDLITLALDQLTLSEKQRYSETQAQRESINAKLKSKYDAICQTRLAFIEAINKAERKKGNGWLAGIFLGLVGAVVAVVALPVVAPLFAAAGLAGAAATSSGMAVIGLGAMATAPLVAGAVGGAAGLVVGSVAASSPAQSIKATRIERLGVDYQISAEEAAKLAECEKELDRYYQLLTDTTPSTASRALFRELPPCAQLKPLPPFMPSVEISEACFDGQFYHLLVAAL